MSDALDFLRKSQARSAKGWNICYYDPPYATDYSHVIDTIGAPGATLLLDGGVLIAEHHHKTELPDRANAIRRWRIVKQGDSCLSFYEGG